MQHTTQTLKWLVLLSTIWLLTDSFTFKNGSKGLSRENRIIEAKSDPPVARCNDITVELDTGGQVEINALDLDNGSINNCSIGNLSFTVDPSKFDCDDLGDNEVIFNVFDDCGNRSSCTATVNIEDNQNVLIESPDDITVNLNSGECGTEVFFEVLIVDNCEDNIEITYEPEQASFFDIGLTTVTFTVEESSGNTIIDSFMVQINEFIPTNPQLGCNYVANLVLDDNCEGHITAEILLEGEESRCYDRFQVFILDVSSPDSLVRPNSPNVGFDDIDNTLTVKVLDTISGNNCIGLVEVEDKKAPYIEAPSDLEITCDFVFDLEAIEDLSNTLFGTIRLDPLERDSIILFDRYCGDNLNDSDDDPSNDPDFPYINNDLFDPLSPSKQFRKSVGLDGFVVDNCGVTININVIPNINCGRGVVTRVFTATDPQGRTSGAIQRINIIDCQPFFINDIDCNNTDDEDGVIWPCDFVMDECPDDVNLELTGSPQILDTECDQVAFTFEDQTISSQPTDCIQIRRKWLIIDWCEFDQSDTDLNDEFDFTDDGQIQGLWQYIQDIKISNTEGPVFSPCEDITICALTENCTGFTSDLIVSVTDDCTAFNNLITDYKIDLFNDGVFNLTGFGNDANNATQFTPGLNGAFPLGTHRIVFTAADECRNIQTCEYLFTVIDCLAPDVIDINAPIIVNANQSGCTSVSASIFSSDVSDNCSTNDHLTFSFSDDISDTLRVFCCFAPDFQSNNPLSIYVTDEAGNQSTFSVFLQIGGCGNIDPPPVPTLGEWGLILFTLLLLTTGTLVMIEPSLSVAGAQSFSLKNLPFDWDSYLRSWLWVFGLIVLIFSVAIIGFGYEVKGVDPMGATACSLVVAYWFYLVFE